jgi:hypothetical protein
MERKKEDSYIAGGIFPKERKVGNIFLRKENESKWGKTEVLRWK